MSFKYVKHENNQKACILQTRSILSFLVRKLSQNMLFSCFFFLDFSASCFALFGLSTFKIWSQSCNWFISYLGFCTLQTTILTGRRCWLKVKDLISDFVLSSLLFFVSYSLLFVKLLLILIPENLLLWNIISRYPSLN